MSVSHLKGYSQVAAGAILFGLIGIFVKLIPDMSVGSIIFYRLLVSTITVGFYFALTGSFKNLVLNEKKVYILLLGIFQAGTMLGFFISIKYTTVAIAVLLLYTAPIYVALLSPIILKEPITRHGLAALILAIAGVIMVVQPQTISQDGQVIGLAAGLVSGLAYACLILTSRKLRNHYTGTVQASWALFITMVIFIPYSMVPTGVLLDNLLLLIPFGFIPTIALILYLSGLRHIKAQNASIMGLLEPVSAAIFAYIILSEPISIPTLIGGGLILLGAFLVSREKPVEYIHE
ncbi:MAG TPA: EamA family transporter [Candidatus Nanoarchaeia archaeon]|nr:EamA family transporter [Candidatus Nanoarchaeia archaeon]